MQGGFLTLDGGFTRRPVAGWTPAALSPLGWYDASQETGKNDGDAVLPTDFSGNGNNMTQATSSMRPLYKTNIQNSLPVFRFDGSDDRVVASFSLLQPCWRFIVFKLVAVNATQQSRIASGDVNDQTDLYFSATESAPLKTYSGSVATVSAAYGTATFERTGVVYNGASSKAVKGAGSIVTINPGTVGMNGAALGGGSDGAGFAQADIAECIVGSGALSDDDITAAMDYLKDKWGVT